MKRSAPRFRVFHPLLFMGAVLLGLGCSSEEPTQPPPPPTPVPTTITLSATTVSFQALGATQTLTATVKDQNGNTLSGQTTTWSSDNTAVASVSTSGVVTAAAQGTATITGTSGSLSATASVTVTQVAASRTAVSGDAQTGTVGQQLAQDLVVQVDDSNANPIPGVVVSFAVSGGGSLSAATGTTAADGRASTSWTLGTTAGTGQQVTASVTGLTGTTVFTVTADPDVAANIALLSGDAQTGPFSSALSVPLVVSVTDQFSNGAPGVSVTFAATPGDGTFNPTTATTDAAGEASSVWTLGAPLGTQQATATATGLTGSPVPFSATSILLSLTAISADPIVEGATVTLTGNFSPTPTDNTVLIDGQSAAVTAATATTLDVIVPSFSCQPARDVNVTVTLSSATTSPLTPRLNPISFTGDVALGQQFFTLVPANFCLQFAPSATGGDAYIIGVGSARELPTSQMAFDIVATAGAASPSSPFGSPPMLATPRRGVGVSELSDELTLARMRQMQAESRLRAWERENLDPARSPSLQIAPQRSAGLFAVPPNVGDMLTFRVPDADGPDACQFTEITTEVKVVGASGIFVTDVSNPATDSLTLTDLQAASDTFDLMFDQDTLYFGAPSDIDVNQRVLVILTWEVNKFPAGFAGFVFSGDLFDRASCATSDFGEIFYSHVPDPTNTAGSGARSKASVLAQMPSLIAHEFTHVIQTSRRLILLSGTGMDSWEAEGQATFAEEVVGHAVLGNMTGQNYDGTVATAANAGAVWYRNIFTLLARYFGWDPTNPGTRLADTPELCTLFGSLSLSTACAPFWHYGASWSFMRYLSDRYDASYVGTDKSGEVGLHRDWVSRFPTSNGVANVEALLGVEIDSLFARWAAMLYVDDQAATIDSAISMTSWDLVDVFTTLDGLFVGDFSPLPAQRGFADFTDALLAVRGGSTRYTRVSAAGARPALAIRVQAAGGGDLGPTMNPQIWIVRTQ